MHEKVSFPPFDGMMSEQRRAESDVDVQIVPLIMDALSGEPYALSPPRNAGVWKTEGVTVCVGSHQAICTLM